MGGLAAERDLPRELPLPPEKKKRQHFVPRLILRKFSEDGRRVSLVILASGKRVCGASLKEQCYRDYFYDKNKDGKIENAFQNLEGVFSRVLGDHSSETLQAVSDADLFVIAFFVLLQKLRTVGAAESANETHDAFLKRVFARDARFVEQGIDLNKFRIGLKRPQDENLLHAATSWPILLDLEIKFLVNGCKVPFVVSDDPVVPYNQFVEHHPKLKRWPACATGLATKGLQLFLPLSPRVCVAMYDPATYTYGSPKRRTCGIGTSDVRLLNTLQALHAHSCVYYQAAATDGDEVYRLVKVARGQHSGWRKTETFESEIVQRPDGTSSQLVGFRTPDLRVGAKFGFATVTDHSTFDGYDRAILPIRSEELMEISNSYHRDVREKINKTPPVRGEGDDTGE